MRFARNLINFGGQHAPKYPAFFISVDALFFMVSFDLIAKPVRNDSTIISDITVTLFILTLLCIVHHRLPLTPACMSRCVANVITYLGIPI